jgi:integrase
VPLPRPAPETTMARGVRSGWEQVMQLLAASRNTRDRALLTLAVTAGMRQGEIFALTWDDIEPAARTISIKRTLAEPARVI